MIENRMTTITPFLTVNNGKSAVDFYLSAFGAMEIERHGMPEEKLIAKISIEGAEFWVGDEETQFGNFCPDNQSGCAVRIILQTKKADELFGQALKFVATQICPMTTETDWRIGKLKDPFGHIWEIGFVL